MIKIALIGCTGNIGKQVAQVVRQYPQEFCFSSLVCKARKEEFFSLCKEFSPTYGACTDYEGLELPAPVRALKGQDVLRYVFEGCDVAFIAAGGFAGLAYTLQAIKEGKKIALANKESLVCGGELVMRAVEERRIDLVPVDSEHSALFQALYFDRKAKFSKLVLTASGGPFLRYSQEELACVTAKDALKHPTWDMGAKITVDSATLLNKGYEVIEAKWLYGASFEQIEAVVHPESIVHSLVSFEDGSMLAQMGYPDMRLPIQLALTYPNRLPCLPALDLLQCSTLHFYELPQDKFPCFNLAILAGKAGGTCPTILNGAGEEAVYAFLRGGITFPQIAQTIEATLDAIPFTACNSFETLVEADGKARRRARELIYGK